MSSMYDKLKELLKNSYSPYYNFPVAAIVVMDDGAEFVGVNVENANGTSICAERHAIGNAIAHGYKKGDFNKIYIMLSSGECGAPCFACRQVLLEFMDLEDKIISVGGTGEEKVYTLDELCPEAFDKEDLK